MRWALAKRSRPSPLSLTSWSISVSTDLFLSLCHSRKSQADKLKPNGGFIMFIFSFSTKMCLFFIFGVFFDSTLSNWVYEFDKWAPSVVKVSYKVSHSVLHHLNFISCIYIYIYIICAVTYYSSNELKIYTQVNALLNQMLSTLSNKDIF